jgi:hypothetical protein
MTRKQQQVDLSSHMVRLSGPRLFLGFPNRQLHQYSERRELPCLSLAFGSHENQFVQKNPN